MSEDVLPFRANELEQFLEDYMALDRRVQRPKSLFSVLRGKREWKYQYALNYFLDPQKPHGFGHTLLASFFECADFHEYHLSGQHIELDDEVWIADNDKDGRIDLVICGGSALSDHPRWGLFIELKVGAQEGSDQTKKYADTNSWNFNWFNSHTIDVDRLENALYLYVKKEDAADPESPNFESIDWSMLAESFDRSLRGSFFDYPNRSVIQFSDFIQSLKETEHMDSPINADELNERLNVYFHHRELIQEVEKANSQFESDFEELSTFLQDHWVDHLTKKYDFEHSGWKTTTSTNPKFQGIQPDYWSQDPLDRSSTIRLYFRHSPTTELLREQTFTFRLRLPPQRNVHTSGNPSFNTIFTKKCEQQKERIVDALGPDFVYSMNSAAALVSKDYPLDTNNLTESYVEQLDIAVSECCCNDEFVHLINEIFEESYLERFAKEPEGRFPGPLPLKASGH